MDKKKSLWNISVSIFFKIVVLLLTLMTRRVLIQVVGNTANGLLSLYTSIIGFLAIADLGVGSAISFCMYKPIVDNDNKTVSALYRLFIKIYTIIALIILIVGLLVTPILPIIAKDYGNINIYSTFIIMLLSVVLSYFYSAKVSVINAYKNNYITTIIMSISLVFESVLQIVLLYIFKSFEMYLLCKILSQILQWILTSIYFNKHHKILFQYNNKLDVYTKNEVSKKTKAMFLHKIGTLMVNTCDSIIISAFIGVIILGKYSNYTVIITSMNSILVLFFTPLTSIIGHLCIEANIDTQKKYFNFFYGINFTLGIIFYLGYFSIIDDLINVIFGSNLTLSKDVSFIITLNYFIQFMRTSTLTFRDATGTFYYDRFKPLFEGVLNLILSLLFVVKFGIVGVLVATIITNIVICHIVEPYVLYKHSFNSNPKKYFVVNYVFILIFVVFLLVLSFCHIELHNYWLNILVNGLISVSLSVIPVFIMFFYNKDYRDEVCTLIKKIMIRR